MKKPQCGPSDEIGTWQIAYVRRLVIIRLPAWISENALFCAGK
jgi:hypothetical protein